MFIDGEAFKSSTGKSLDKWWEVLVRQPGLGGTWLSFPADLLFRHPGVSSRRGAAPTRSGAKPTLEQRCSQNRERLGWPAQTHRRHLVPEKRRWASIHPVYSSTFQHVLIKSGTGVCCNCPLKFCTWNPDTHADFYRDVLWYTTHPLLRAHPRSAHPLHNLELTLCLHAGTSIAGHWRSCLRACWTPCPRPHWGTASDLLNSPASTRRWLQGQCQGQGSGVRMLIERKPTLSSNCWSKGTMPTSCWWPYPRGGGIGFIGKLPVWEVMEVADSSYRRFDCCWRAGWPVGNPLKGSSLTDPTDLRTNGRVLLTWWISPALCGSAPFASWEPAGSWPALGWPFQPDQKLPVTNSGASAMAFSSPLHDGRTLCTGTSILQSDQVRGNRGLHMVPSAFCPVWNYF